VRLIDPIILLLRLHSVVSVKVSDSLSNYSFKGLGILAELQLQLEALIVIVEAFGSQRLCYFHSTRILELFL
jgi:hypothetical protein